MTKQEQIFVNNTIYNWISKCSNILIGNPMDLLELDMNEFYVGTYFISSPHLEKGTMLKIVDEDLKYDLIKFCIENEDRVFRGCKESNGRY